MTAATTTYTPLTDAELERIEFVSIHEIGEQRTILVRRAAAEIRALREQVMERKMEADLYRQEADTLRASEARLLAALSTCLDRLVDDHGIARLPSDHRLVKELCAVVATVEGRAE